MLSPEFAQLIGEIVIASAWVEETASTLLQNSEGNWDTRAVGYGDSGKSLTEALNDHISPDTKDKLAELFSQRNYVVHGVCLSGYPTADNILAMKHQQHNKITKHLPPQRDEREFSIAELKQLAEELWLVQEELQRIADAEHQGSWIPEWQGLLYQRAEEKQGRSVSE